MSENKKFFGVNSENWGHKWGYRDSNFIVNDDKSVTFTGNRYPVCGKKLTKFIPFVEEALGVEFDIKPKVQELEKKYIEQYNTNNDFIDELKSLFEEDRFTFTDNERLLHSHGQHSTR